MNGVKENMKVIGVREEDEEVRVTWRQMSRCGEKNPKRKEGEGLMNYPSMTCRGHWLSSHCLAPTP